MRVYLISCLLLQLLGSLRVSSLELVANYKFWDSISDQIIYDYSGNSNHGQYWGYKPMFTDRGINSKSSINICIRGMGLSSKLIQGYSDLEYSFWALRTNQTSKISHYINGNQTFHVLDYHLSSSYANLTYYDGYNPCSYYNCPDPINIINGWNLYTLRLHSNFNNKTTRYMDLYNNLIPLRNYYSNNFTSMLNVKVFQIYITDLIVYELWAHTGFSSIKDLDSLIYNGCPTSPSISCLPLHDEFKNSLGVDCPNNCKTNFQSCDNNLACIQHNNTSCLFGLYQRDTGDCIFFTPDNSANCTVTYIPIEGTGVSTFECSCNKGFKKISDSFVGCVPDSWEYYHKLGNIYLEKGYTLDSKGKCCICEESYLAISITPLVCEYMPYCLDYTVEENRYVCNSMETGYKLDPFGNCCICEEEYVVVSNRPLICIYMPNCLFYTKEDYSYLCSECIEGYQLDSEYQCLDCSEGYEKISGNAQGCIRKLDQCIEYIEIEDDWKCKECKSGYRLSLAGLCDECSEGYFKIQGSSLICIPEILNCIEYDFSSENPICMDCREGYMLDSNYMCSSCEIDYLEISRSPLECAHKVNRCISYEIYQGRWVCNICEQGYKLDNEKNCGHCADGYTSQSIGVLECLPIPDCSAGYKNCTEDYENQSQSSDQGENEEEVITQAQKERGETIQAVNTATTSTVMASTSVSALLSTNPSTLIFYFNTIQLLSYIQYLNINLPFEIKKEQEASNKFTKNLNIISYINIEDKSPREYISHNLNDENGFLPNMIYKLLILMLLFILNTIFNLLNKFGKGKIKDLAVKILILFNYTIYIQFVFMTYIDSVDVALIKIKNVRSK